MPTQDALILEKLFNYLQEGKPYPCDEKYQSHLIEQYKLYVEMADRVSARRQASSSFFLSVNTAIVGIVEYLNFGTTSKPGWNFFFAVAIAGVVLSLLWYRIIRSYRDLNTAKFKVIHEIEKKLPINPYTAEWNIIGCGNCSELYTPLTQLEICVPWIFLLLHVLVLIRSFL